MSKPDWKDAPEWATHHGMETETHFAAWYRVDALGVRGFCDAASTNKYQQSASYLDDFPAVETLERRP